MSALTDRGHILTDIDAHAGRLKLLHEETGTRPMSDEARANRLHSLACALLTETEIGQPPDRLLIRALCAECVLWLEALPEPEAMAMPP